MKEDEIDIDNYIKAMQIEHLYPRYAILQLVKGNKTHQIRFESLDSLNKQGLVPNSDDYEMIYFKVNETYDTNVNLESIFIKFNADEPRPSNYYGHSLSVSDVVLISETGTDIKAYYCDKFGFKELDNNFIKQKIQIRFERGTTIRDEYDLLHNAKSNNLTKEMQDREDYLIKEYERIFNMADQRAELEEKKPNPQIAEKRRINSIKGR